MQCNLYQIHFWKVFHMYNKLICILYALLCGQNFILVENVGVTLRTFGTTLVFNTLTIGQQISNEN
jgi:hypothetical protein